MLRFIMNYVSSSETNTSITTANNSDNYKVDYYPNGNKRSEGNFKDGNRVGEWTYYQEDGSVKK